MTNRFRLLLSLLLVSVTAWAYQGGTTKNHNHSNNAGDGGQLSNLSVIGTTTNAGPLVLTGKTQGTTGEGMNRLILKTYAVPQANWNTSTSSITITNHGYYTPIAVLLSSTGTLPASLSASTTYWLYVIDNNTVAISSTASNAVNNLPYVFASSGSAPTTITPLTTHTLTLNANGSPAVWIDTCSYNSANQTCGPTQLFIGGRQVSTQPSEVLHAESNGSLSVGADASADMAVYNTTTSASRFIAFGGPCYQNKCSASVVYLTAYGSQDNQTLFTNGPNSTKMGEVLFQNSNGAIIRTLGSGGASSNNMLFQIDATNPLWQWFDKNGAEYLAIAGTYIRADQEFVPLAQTKAQLAARNPNILHSLVSCSDCGTCTASICISTGTSTVGQWGCITNPTTGCK